VVSPGFWTKRQTFLRYEKQSTGVLTLCCTVPQKIEAYCRSLKPYIYIYITHLQSFPKTIEVAVVNQLSHHKSYLYIYINPFCWLLKIKSPFHHLSLNCSWLNPCKSQCFWVKTHIFP
jgi:hypothetical protein